MLHVQSDLYDAVDLLNALSVVTDPMLRNSMFRELVRDRSYASVGGSENSSLPTASALYLEIRSAALLVSAQPSTSCSL